MLSIFSNLTSQRLPHADNALTLFNRQRETNNYKIAANIIERLERLNLNTEYNLFRAEQTQKFLEKHTVDFKDHYRGNALVLNRKDDSNKFYKERVYHTEHHTYLLEQKEEHDLLEKAGKKKRAWYDFRQRTKSPKINKKGG